MNNNILLLMLSMYCLLPLQKCPMSCTYQEISAMVDPKMQPETPTIKRGHAAPLSHPTKPKHVAHGQTYTNWPLVEIQPFTKSSHGSRAVMHTYSNDLKNDGNYLYCQPCNSYTPLVLLVIECKYT
jgi:hypothetical protein